MAYDAEIQILWFPKTISNPEAQISIVSQENQPIHHRSYKEEKSNQIPLG